MKKIELHIIELIGEDQYHQTCNSRIGGKPDLPKDFNYPVRQDGFLEFLLQVNLNENPIKGLPEKGMISLFNGNLDKREAWGYFFNELNNFELKEIPDNSNFSGVVDYHETVAHKFKIVTKEAIALSEVLQTDELNDGRLNTYWNNSYLNSPGLIDSSELYLRTNNFELISYAVKLSKQKQSIFYSGRNGKKVYKTAKDVIECEIDNFPNNIFYPKVSTRKEFNEQIERFETYRDYHLKRYLEFDCLLSLSSLDETKMIWGDYHKLELYGFRSKFNKSNFSELYVWLA